MSLLREELYKITSKRIVKIGFGSIIVIMMIMFLMVGPMGEHSTVGGREYDGFEAIAKDREISEAYEGVLTDKKLADMADTYGFVQMKVDEYGYSYENMNNITLFLLENDLTDGVYTSDEDYHMATRTLPLKETAMGGLTHQDISFTYVKGWIVCRTMMSVAAMLTCILIMIGLTPIFADEYALKTAPVLLTTVHGRKKDIGIKMLAGLIFSVASFAVIMLLTFLMSGICYGFQGLGAPTGLVENQWYLGNEEIGSVSFMPLRTYFLLFLLICLVGIVMMDAFIMLASAVSRQPFGALIATTIFFVFPAGIWFYLIVTGAEGEWALWAQRIMFCTPLYSAMNGTVRLSITELMVVVRAVMFAVIAFPSVIVGYVKYQNHQVS